MTWNHGKMVVMLVALAGAGTARPAQAAEVAVSGTASSAAPASAEGAEERPMRRFRPERNMIELGVFGGFTLFSRNHDLYHPSTTPQEPLRRPTPDLGVRLAYFPLRFLGVEAEFSALPARYAPGGSAFIYGFRGSAILQLPFYRVVPFLLGGYGLMGVSSAQSVAGKDIDPMGHYGIGVKYFVNRWLALRLDIRHLIGAQAALQVDGTSHLQMLLGLSVTLGRAKPRPQPAAVDPDRDRDGFLNDVDQCPDEPGIAPHGCPDRDSDGDGFLDSVDACPTVPGVAPDGCPLRDTDGDGILDKDDRCVNEPETRNGFEDADGCPDELPAKVVKFTGVIRGIFFDFNKDTIRKQSTKTLNEAAKIFNEYPELRVEISGHTDNVGKDDYNKDLSRRRAEAVKRFLVDKGVKPERITTRGAGPDEPVADNASAGGRAKNRRIEFKIMLE